MNVALINFLPFIAAILYGLAYAIVARGFPNVNAYTFAVVEGLAYAAIPLLIAYGQPHGPSWSSLVTADWRSLALVIIAAICASSALMITVVVSKDLSPTYAALGEIGYVVLTPFFVWLLFSYRDFNKFTIIGGAIVLAGLAVVYYGQATRESADSAPAAGG